jgi:hypothetical protein
MPDDPYAKMIAALDQMGAQMRGIAAFVSNYRAVRRRSMTGFPRNPEAVVARTLDEGRGMDIGQLAIKVILDLRAAGWKVRGEYHDRTGSE